MHFSKQLQMGKTDRNKVEREKKAASLCQGGGLSLVSFTFFVGNGTYYIMLESAAAFLLILEYVF